MPELTKPTTITEVAEDDWMIAVTAVPSRMPLIGVLDNRKRIFSILLPATFLRLSPIRDMPKRKSATPPSKESTFEILTGRNYLLQQQNINRPQGNPAHALSKHNVMQILSTGSPARYFVV